MMEKLFKALLGLAGFMVFVFVVTVVSAVGEVLVFLTLLPARRFFKKIPTYSWPLTRASFVFGNKCYDWSGLPD